MAIHRHSASLKKNPIDISISNESDLARQEWNSRAAAISDEHFKRASASQASVKACYFWQQACIGLCQEYNCMHTFFHVSSWYQTGHNKRGFTHVLINSAPMFVTHSHLSIWCMLESDNTSITKTLLEHLDETTYMNSVYDCSKTLLMDASETHSDQFW